MTLERLEAPRGAFAKLRAADPKQAGDMLEAHVASERFQALPTAARTHIQDAAPEALELLREQKPLAFKHLIATEALIRTTGRPALLIRDDGVQLDTPEAEGWLELEHFTEVLAPVIAGVGRIDLAGAHVGTGFLIAPDLVLTNRHVAEVIAKAFRKEAGEVWLMKAGGAVIDFVREADSDRTLPFAIRRILATGPYPIDMRVDPTRLLDAALLEIAPKSLDGESQPAPLPLLPPGAQPNNATDEILSIGYPGGPGFEPKGPTPTSEEREVMTALKRIFETRYGVKRLSPGEILSPEGRFPDGGHNWVFTHDATTLGGASGSCVVRLLQGQARVIGLHFGGAWLKHNFAHLLARLREPLLSGATINWAELT
jgi:hypothetical protein